MVTTDRPNKVPGVGWLISVEDYTWFRVGSREPLSITLHHRSAERGSILCAMHVARRRMNVM
jgi:hypothetical protein